MNQIKQPAVNLVNTPVEPEFDEFEYKAYSRCSDNNMPCFTTFVPLTDAERAEVEEALKLQ